LHLHAACREGGFSRALAGYQTAIFAAQIPKGEGLSARLREKE